MVNFLLQIKSFCYQELLPHVSFTRNSWKCEGGVLSFPMMSPGLGAQLKKKDPLLWEGPKIKDKTILNRPFKYYGPKTTHFSANSVKSIYEITVYGSRYKLS